MGEKQRSTKGRRELLCQLTPEEKAELAERLTDKIELRNLLEDSKKVMVKQYAAKIEEATAEINDLSSKIRGGNELRMVDVETVYDDPTEGMKTTYRLDTNEIVVTARMTDDEMQPELFDGQDLDGEDDREENEENE